ncbi:MAG: hypothetical protein PHH82_02065 [Candidatus ainarchaeum sp.]|nr:hypothetical protein [Candidatus ainarchaeum sp.]
MELEKYLTKSFATTFKVKPYLSSLFVTVVIGVLFIAGIFAFFFDLIKQFMLTLGKSALTGQMANSMLGFKLVMALGTGFIIFCVILCILNIIGQAFIFKKVEAEMESKNDGFFERFGASMLLGLKVFVVMIIYYIVVGIIGAIIFAIGLIPYVGLVISIILYVILGLYTITGFFAIYGFTAKGGIAKGISASLTLPFRKIHLVGYSFIFMIIAMAIGFVLGLLGMIPVLGQILYILGMPIITTYMMGISYCMATEE